MKSEQITRPVVDVDNLRINYDFSLQQLQLCVESARRRPQSLSLVIDHAATVATCGHVLDPDTDDVVGALKIAAQAHAAMFTVVSSPEDNVTAPLGNGEQASYDTRLSDTSTADVHSWLDGVFLSLLCRDQDSLKRLMATLLEVLERCVTENPRYRFLLAEALRLWWYEEDGVAKKFIETMQETDPSTHEFASEKFVLDIDVPIIQCLLYALAEDADFAAAFARAAQMHKEYWTSTMKRRRDWDGFLSIPLLGIAALAYDRNLPFELDCDYVPMSLVRDLAK
jgi:hypothetical protein